MLDSGPCNYLVFLLLLATSAIYCRFHWIISDGDVNGIRRNRKRSDSSNPKSVKAYDLAYNSDFDFV